MSQSQQDDAPSPPGGPLRQDSAGKGADGGLDPHDTGVDHESEASLEDEHGGTIPLDEEESHPEHTDDETPVQRENAESSQDQPSEG